METPSGVLPVLEGLNHPNDFKRNADDPDKAEHFVRVQWLDTVPEKEAVNELGFGVGI